MEAALLERSGEALAELLWPTRCVCCNMPGEVLCAECRANLPWIVQRWACPVCGAPNGWLTCTECDRSRDHDDETMGGREPASITSWPTRAAICSCSFQGAAASMVTALKDGHELRLASVMAAALACSLEEAQGWNALDGRHRFDALHTDALCYVPATAAAYARRGFDHMELVSHGLSAFTGIPLLDALGRHDAHDQRTLGREGRAENLSGTMEVLADVSGLRLLLVDDVITTGASVGEATRALLSHGAASVTACALARVC